MESKSPEKGSRLRFFAPEPAIGELKTTIDIPKKMVADLEYEMKCSGYNLRQRAIWITEAIEALLQYDSPEQIILDEFSEAEINVRIQIKMTQELRNKIDTICEKASDIAGSRISVAMVTRSAIKHRLITEQGKKIIAFQKNNTLST